MAAPSPPLRHKDEDKTLSLLTLNPDALCSVMVRTPASEHNNLRATCRAFRDLLDSQNFRVERAITGWAETHTTLLTPQEMYAEDNPPYDDMSDDDDCFDELYDDLGARDPDYGYRQMRARIWVDGKLGGKASITIVPRPPGMRVFHEICDAISSELQKTGCDFCDTRGRPRLACVKETGPDAATGGFAYIEKFELHPEYRQATIVGAVALRSLLCSTRLLGEWSLAAYIADARANFTEDDRQKVTMFQQRQMEEFHRERSEGTVGPTADEIEESKEWDKRFDLLAKHDMRQFFRAGFQQAKELVLSSDCYHLFAVPSFLNGDMMSADEALAIHIAEKPVLPDRPTGANAELLKLLVESCSKRRYKTQTIGSDNIRSEIQAHRRLLQGTQDALNTMLNKVNQECQQHLNDAQVEEVRKVVEEKQVEMQTEIDNMCSTIDRAEESFRAATAELESMDSQVRSEVARLTDEAGATVEGSHALHCCACNFMPEYIDLLLDFVAEPKKRDVINGLDCHGMTPLMVAAQSTHGSTPDIRYRLCEKLIGLGADKNIVNLSGKTALGEFRTSERSVNDFSNVFGIRSSRDAGVSEEEVSSQLERLLMPSGGGTPADNAVLDEQDDEHDSDHDSNEFEDDDEEDESDNDDGDEGVDEG